MLLALLVQPACLLHTRMAMASAAAEGARLAVTCEDEAQVEEYVRRRLAAVPEVSAFHVGGAGDWEVGVEGCGTGGARVEVVGHARPLPLLSSVVAAIGGSDGEGVVLREVARAAGRPVWLGGSYGEWVGMWG